MLQQNKSYKSVSCRTSPQFISNLWPRPQLCVTPPSISIFSSPHSYLCFLLPRCPFVLTHRQRPIYLPVCPSSLINLCVGWGTLRRLSYCPGWGKSIDFLMCSFLFLSRTVFDIVPLFRRREQSLFLCLQWSWSFRKKVVAISLQSRKTYLFDLLLFLLH